MDAHDIDYQHERKWHRFKVAVFHQNKEKEITAFGEEYKIDEIKNETDDLLSKYVDEHQPTTWKLEKSGELYTTTK